MALVTASEILAYAGVKSPSAAETEWAGLCASAVEAGVIVRLNGAAITEPPPDELHLVAIMAGGDAYKRRETPYGSTGYNDGEAAATFARDYLDSVRPQIDRYGNGPGIG